MSFIGDSPTRDSVSASVDNSRGTPKYGKVRKAFVKNA